MKQADKSALATRLDGIGMVTPTLAEAQPDQVDNVRDIEIITGEILEAKRVGGEAIITIGQRLIEAKERLPHGEWLPWLTERVEFSERQAQRLMRIAREYENPTLVSDLGARKALQLLALPESEREEFLSVTHQVNGEEKAVIDMTSRELKKVIKERDEARLAAEKAEMDAKHANMSRISMEKSLNEANRLLERAREDQGATASQVADLERQLAELKAAPVDVAVMEVDQAALDKARAEGEAEKAAEMEALQDKLDKAKEAKKKAEEKRKEAEAALADAQDQLEAAAKAQKSAEAMADPDVAMLKVCYEQEKNTFNVIRGLLLKFQNRGDAESVEKTKKIMCAIGSAYGEAIK